MKKLTIACVLRTPPYDKNRDKQKKYTEDDVLKLKKGIDTFLSIDYEFVCLTDQNLTVNSIPLIGDTPGWWAKIELFRPNLFTGPVLYIDLDTIICKNIDMLVASCTGNAFVGLSDPITNTFESGMMYWEGDHSYLWEKYIHDTVNIQSFYRHKPKIGDQAFIEEHVPFIFFKDIPTVNENWFCRLKPTTIPHDDSMILIFAGKTNKPYNEMYNDHPWVTKYWKNIV